MNTVKKKKVQKHAQLTTSLLQHVSLLFFDIYFSNTHLLKKRKKKLRFSVHHLRGAVFKSPFWQ